MKNNILKNTIISFTGTFLLKFVGLFETILIAAVFGASGMSDAFIIAYSVPTVLLAGIGKAITTAYIPQYIENCENKNIDKDKFTSNLIIIIGIIGFAFSIILMIFPIQITTLFAAGLEKEKLEITANMVRVMGFATVPIALQNVLIGFLQARKEFLISTFSAVFVNLTLIIFMLIFKDENIILLAYAMVIGYFITTIFLFIGSYRKSFQFKFYLNLKEPYIKTILFLVIPMFLSSTVAQINSIIDKNFASMLDDGLVSSLDYANKINVIISTLSVTAILTVLFPEFSKCASNKNRKKFKFYVRNSVNSIIMLVLPMTFGVVVLANPIVSILFERGNFDVKASLYTSECLVAYSIGFLGYNLRPLLIRMFYSMGDSKTPAINTTIALCVNIILNIIFFEYLQHFGLALSTSLASIITSILLFYNLNKKISPWVDKDFFYSIIKYLFATGTMTLFIYKFYPFIFDCINLESVYMIKLLSLFITVILAMFIYLAVLMILKEKLCISILFKILKM